MKNSTSTRSTHLQQKISKKITSVSDQLDKYNSSILPSEKEINKINDMIESLRKPLLLAVYKSIIKAIKKRRVYPIETIATYCDCSKKSVSNSIKYLIAEGYIKSQRKNARAKHKFEACHLSDIKREKLSPKIRERMEKAYNESSSKKNDLSMQSIAPYKKTYCKKTSNSYMQKDIPEKKEQDNFNKVLNEKVELVQKQLPAKKSREAHINRREIYAIIAKTPLGLNEIIKSLLGYIQDYVEQPELFKSVKRPGAYIVRMLQNGNKYNRQIFESKQLTENEIAQKKAKKEKEIFEALQEEINYVKEREEMAMQPQVDLSSLIKEAKYSSSQGIKNTKKVSQLSFCLERHDLL